MSKPHRSALCYNFSHNYAGSKLLSYTHLSYQNATKKLFLKCNLCIYFIITRKFYITMYNSFFVTRNHNPFRFIIIISMIYGNNFSCIFCNSLILSQKIDILLCSVSTFYPGNIPIIVWINHLFMAWVAASLRTIYLSSYYLTNNILISV